MYLFKSVVFIPALFLLVFFSSASGQQKLSNEWKTNTSKSLIDLNELKRGGPPKDGIPSIDNPEFISIKNAESWLTPKEPVIAVETEDQTRAYPLQIMIWHEIVNDTIAGKSLLVTFCPLCYSALVFEREVENEILEFGVSGFLRHSDLVMYDRKTETLWQQFTGKAIVGDYVSNTLKQIPSQIISFEQFKNSYPDGKILSRKTGHDRNYGTNPYTGYDDINNTPLFGDLGNDNRLSPMEKVIGVKIGANTKTYPYSITEKKKIIHDKVNDKKIVVFHVDGARSALDANQISNSKESGSTGVFSRKLNGQLLTFELRSGDIFDAQTGSRWSIAGKAVEGPLKGKQLNSLIYGDYFAFAWLIFWPETTIYSK